MIPKPVMTPSVRKPDRQRCRRSPMMALAVGLMFLAGCNQLAQHHQHLSALHTDLEVIEVPPPATVLIAGEVQRPGTVVLPDNGLTILAAIASSGGPIAFPVLPGMPARPTGENLWVSLDREQVRIFLPYSALLTTEFSAIMLRESDVITLTNQPAALAGSATSSFSPPVRITGLTRLAGEYSSQDELVARKKLLSAESSTDIQVLALAGNSAQNAFFDLEQPASFVALRRQATQSGLPETYYIPTKFGSGLPSGTGPIHLMPGDTLDFTRPELEPLVAASHVRASLMQISIKRARLQYEQALREGAIQNPPAGRFALLRERSSPLLPGFGRP